MRTRAVLLLPAAALLIGTPAATAGTPRATPTGRATPTARATLKSFLSPSGNIACQLSALDGDDGVRCDIKVHDWHPKRPKSCPLAYGDSIGVGSSGRAGLVCHGDTVFGSYPKLAYGDSESLGVFTCSSATTGVTCTDTRTRHGFFISKASYRLF